MKTPKARKLPSGSWFVQLRLDGKSISITKPTEKEAVAEAMAIKAGILKKQTGRKTLTAAIDDYIDIRKNVISPATIRGYKIIQKNRFQTMMKRDCFTTSQEQWQKAVNAEARLVSAKTLTNSWRFISSVIFETTGNKIVVRLPQIIPNERSFLSPTEIKVFVQAVKGKKVEIAALLALSSLRCSEIKALTWHDIDLEKGVLSVNGAAVLDENGKLVSKPQTKNRTSRRTIPLIEPLKAALNAVEDKTGNVVSQSSSTIYKAINRVCKENGLPAVGTHGLRHSFASLAYSLGIPEKVTMEIGGWSNDATMKKIYTHVSKDDLQIRTKAFTSYFANENANE